MNADAFIKDAAKDAGELAWRRFGKDKVLYMKSQYSFDGVTEADLLAEKLIISRIRKAYPSHGIIAEESGKMSENAEYVWHIDPIDGTKSFSRHIPVFGTMVALARRKRLILSAVYLPAAKELFFAKAGHGTFLNGKRIHCSHAADLSRTEGLCQSQFLSRNISFLRKLIASPKTDHFSVSTFHCFAANGCYVAAGRYDWVVAPYGLVHDFAAPALILKESGCRITDLKGRPWTVDSFEIVAANPRLHKQLLKLTKGV